MSNIEVVGDPRTVAIVDAILRFTPEQIDLHDHPERGEDNDLTVCEGDVPGCPECAAWRQDAARAQALGRAAVVCLDLGYVDAARAMVLEAVDIEARHRKGRRREWWRATW